jgi:RNA polymerase sigma-70 factor (family 1)
LPDFLYLYFCYLTSSILTETATIALFKKVQTGDTRSFDVLFDMYWEDLYRYCIRVIDDMDDAEDIVQELFCDLWENRERVKIEVGLRAYLYGGLRKKILKRFRDKGIQQKHLDILKSTLLENKGESPLGSLIASDLHKNLLDFLQTLPRKEREVYILNQVEGYSVKEISEQYKTSEQTVRNQLNNAARKLEPVVTNLLS